MKILIKKGTLINADKSRDADMLIEKGRIVKIAKGIKEKADEVIDAKGMCVLPGLIDMHSHLRTPGREDEEDFLSGSRAAVKGGFTTILSMPNTNPCMDNEGLVQWAKEQAAQYGLVSLYPVGAITKGRLGKELTEFAALKNAGCLALSDDGTHVANSALFRRALEYATMCDVLIISHCEDAMLGEGGVIRESAIASKYGLTPVPDIAETISAYRDIALAHYTHARLHLAHVSSAKTVAVIRNEKKKISRLSCETAPHYFILSVGDIEKSGFDGNFKVNPPLGEPHDIEALKEALHEGTIDCIATDHAPHSLAEKELPFESAPNGFIGMEFAFGLSYTYLVKAKVLTIEELVGKLSTNPARILGLADRGALREGMRADVVIADLCATCTLRKETIVSKSKNTPFIGCTTTGVIEKTLHKGALVYERSRR